MKSRSVSTLYKMANKFKIQDNALFSAIGFRLDTNILVFDRVLQDKLSTIPHFNGVYCLLVINNIGLFLKNM